MHFKGSYHENLSHEELLRRQDNVTGQLKARHEAIGIVLEGRIRLESMAGVAATSARATIPDV